MTRKQKKTLFRILLSAALTALLFFIPAEGILKLLLYLIPYFIIGYDILYKALRGIINLQPFDECFLMALATIGAIALGVINGGDYLEAIAVMLFYQVGEWFQSYAVGKSRKSISELMDIRPDYANIETENGIEETDPDEVEPGTVILVRPGERIPIDGIITDGASSLDTSALTGESKPADVRAGDEVMSGCINLSSLIRIRTTKDFDNSTASKIMELVENASSRKSVSENFITKFARYYTPAVVFSALVLAVVPPFFTSFNWPTWIYRALTFLVISCPCALVISIPLSFFAGIGGAGRKGILVKGSNYLEQLSRVRTVVFDKTGTLTKGVFQVTGIYPRGDISESELISLASAVERYSTHPIAVSICRACGDDRKAEEVSELAGCGIRGKVGDHIISVGNRKMLAEAGYSQDAGGGTGTVVFVMKDNEYIGRIVISDVIKDSSAGAVRELAGCGVRRTVMLTGDSDSAAREIAEEIGIKEYFSELLPADKVERVEIMMGEGSGVLAFCGDGINDAPVLTRADIGIAMGGVGSDAAIEAADVVIMDDDPRKIPLAVRISKKCMRIVRGNIRFVICVKLACLILGALGFANMWAAVFADVGVMVLAVLNSIRALRV